MVFHPSDSMAEQQENTTLVIGDRAYETLLTKKFRGRKPYVPADPKKVLCVIPGVIQKIYVKEGQHVRQNDPLLILEAMKMQNDVLACLDGVVKSVHVQVGQLAPKGQILLEFE
jgi:biotin carboxyl carrier protein